MPYTPDLYDGDAIETDFTITFPYTARSFVKVYVDNVLQTITTHYSFLSDTEIRFVTAPPSGTNNIEFRRVTVSPLLVDFTDGASIQADDLDLVNNQILHIAEERTVVDRLDVKEFGAAGDGVTDDTAAFQAAIDSIATTGTIHVPDGDYVVTMFGLTYGAKAIQWKMDVGAVTTDMKSPEFYLFRAGGGGGSVENISMVTTAADQVDMYRAFGTNTSTSGDSRLFAFHFDLKADGTGDEPIRGVVGAVTNNATGTGSVKGLRVSAVDLNTTAGAAALMGANYSITPNANTSGAVALLLQLIGGVADVATGLKLDSGGAVWDNGIVCTQGDEYNDAVLQASMGAGSAAGARFLKLKDAAADVIFEVQKDSTVRSDAGIHGGTSLTNSVAITQQAVSRTAPAGNLIIAAGTNTGRIMPFQTNNLTRMTIQDEGVVLGATRKIMNTTASGASLQWGTGSPEGAATAPVGSLFLRTDGGASTTMYVKETGSGNTGWVAK